MTMKMLNDKRRLLTLLVAAAAALALGAVQAQESDGGETAIEIIQQGIAHDALFALEMTGEWGLATGVFGLMYETTDGGGTWNLLPPQTPLALLGIARAGNKVMVVGQQGFVMTREDGGEWTTHDTGLTQRLLNADLNEAGLAVAVGEFGFIGRSRDGGASWDTIVLDWEQFNEEGYEPHLYEAIIKADGTILVAGEFGLILRSTDGGDTFEAVNTAEESVFDIYLERDTSIGYAVGQEGIILKTMDNGDTWQRLDGGTKANLLGVWSGNGEVVITGIREMLRSSDDGASFSKTDDINVIRHWFQGVAAGVSETKSGDEGFLREQAVYTVGHQGTIAKIVK